MYVVADGRKMVYPHVRTTLEANVCVLLDVRTRIGLDSSNLLVRVLRGDFRPGVLTVFQSLPRISSTRSRTPSTSLQKLPSCKLAS